MRDDLCKHHLSSVRVTLLTVVLHGININIVLMVAAVLSKNQQSIKAIKQLIQLSLKYL